MSFDDLTDADFFDLAPRASKVEADVVLSFAASGRQRTWRLAISLSETIWTEIGAPTRVRLQYAPRSRILRLTADDRSGRFEFHRLGKGKRRWVRAVVPEGLVPQPQSCEPEHYVDAVGKVLLIEPPGDFGLPKMLPPPGGGDASPAADEKLIRAYLGLADAPLPTSVGGIRLAPALMTVLAVFAKRELVSRDAIMAATADPADPGDDDRDPKLADVYVSKLRQAVGPLGLAIGRAAYGAGWSMSNEHRARLRALLAEPGR